MLQHRSMIKVADNSGAQEVMLIRVMKRGNKRYAEIGDIITAIVKKAIPYASVKKSDIVKAVVIRTKKEKRRKDGSYIRFDDNAVVLIKGLNDPTPLGTRVFGPVAREIKELGFNKIASMAKEMY